MEICHVNIMETAIQHRHHGSWFIALGAFRCALSLIAAARSGKVQVPQDWMMSVDTAITVLEFWGQEAVDLQRYRDILCKIWERLKNPQA